MFLSRIKPVTGGLGFEAEGWTLAIVDDATGNADGWTWRFVAPTNAPAGLVPGQAANVVGDHIVALAQREPGDHAGFLVRWTPEALAAVRVDEAEWWSSGKWSQGAPSVVLTNAGPESSLHHDPGLDRWLHVRSDGFGATTIVLSSAPAIEGPWSAPQTIFTPPESSQPKAFVYAAKGHPELEGADLVVTYATNTLGDFAGLVADTSLYFPRFVKVTRRR